MIRILQCVNIMDRAGLENMLMNYYRHIDRSKIQFDFLTHRKEDGVYDEEIKSLGGRIYHAPRLYPNNYVEYFKWMKDFFNNHPEYTIVHSHIDSMSFFPILAAKISKIPFRIAHSHSSKLDLDFKFPIKFITLKLIPYVANVYCACGKIAGKFMFGRRKFNIVNNAVDVKKYAFKANVRKIKRDELNVNDKIVIGHVGRFCYIKNQIFLLRVLKEIIKINKKSHLILVGNGNDEEIIRKKIVELDLVSHVTLLKDRDDVADLYQAMDVFVMPSLFEGLPLVGVEAQANGLPCIFSNKISSEVLFLDTSKMLSLGDSERIWANEILDSVNKRTKNEIVVDQFRNRGFDITTESLKLMEFYETLIKNDVNGKETV